MRAANALTAWRIPESVIDRVGEAFAASPSVSHCYARSTHPDWPYGLYAMVHAQSRDELLGIVRGLAETAGAVVGAEVGHRLLETVRECKKSSVRYFG